MDLENFLHFVNELCNRHDPNEVHHPKNVVAFVKGLAEAIDYPKAKVDDLFLACHLHDVGKLSVDDVILRNPGKLKKEEIVAMQRHPVVGFEVVSLLGLDPIVPQIILEHHECWDGTGYPHGLKGEQICMEARMVRICDSFDALTSDRAYRKAFTAEGAKEIMEKNKETYDPGLLEVFFAKVVRI